MVARVCECDAIERDGLTIAAKGVAIVRRGRTKDREGGYKST